MKKKLFFSALILVTLALIFTLNTKQNQVIKIERVEITPTQKGKKKTIAERAMFSEARQLHEYYRQVNPLTGQISKNDKNLEFDQARNAQTLQQDFFARAIESNYLSRGPSNFGGRARALVIDKTDPTENTMLAAGVTGGVFRTTNGGNSWTKVSPFDEIHSATCLVQDPRAGFENNWYYGTGEFWFPNVSAGGFAGSPYYGQGIWKSVDNGITWSQMPSTASSQVDFDSSFDYIARLAIHPISGDLYAAANGEILRFDGNTWTAELSNPSFLSNFDGVTDVTITSTGRVYAAFSGGASPGFSGVWTSPNGLDNWLPISPSFFTPTGRVVLALAPSNENKLYTLFVNGNVGDCSGPVQEADLWLWDQSNQTYTNYTDVLPFEGGCLSGNDPFHVQSGWDLCVAVKPDNENFVLIGGTNAYKKEDITDNSSRFSRIGGYLNSGTYATYNSGTGVEQHPDQHDFVFSNLNSNICFSATDGGIHKTNDITAPTVGWQNLNNNFQTYQFFHVGLDPLPGSNLVIGGTQDNGTTVGGTDFGLPDLTTQTRVNGGDGVAVAISRDGICNGYFGTQNGPIFRAACDGSNFADITPNSSSSQFVTYFYLDPDNNNALYYAGLNTLYRTIDANIVSDLTWDNLGDTFTAFGHDDWFQTFSTSTGSYNPSSSYLLMGGDGGHIYKLDDPWNATSLNTATDITPGTATTGFPSYVTGLAVHPTNNDIVLATYSNYGINNIYLTTNATSNSPTWALVERNLFAHSIRSAAITEVDGEVLYFVGTARGLYSSTDPTSVDWVREAPNQVGYALVSSLDYRHEDKKLLVGTFGNGMYEATLSQTLSINEVDNNTITIYPNPAYNVLNFKGLNNNSYSYRILNSLGQELLTSIETDTTIDIAGLNPGLYFVELKIDNKKTIKRFVKK